MAAMPKFANEVTPQKDANFGSGTLEHFAQEWEPAFAACPVVILCPENRHYVS